MSDFCRYGCYWDCEHRDRRLWSTQAIEWATSPDTDPTETLGVEIAAKLTSANALNRATLERMSTPEKFLLDEYAARAGLAPFTQPRGGDSVA